jgi:biotin synthase
MLHTAVQHAYSVLETGMPVNKEVALELAGLSGEDTLDLLSLANKVKNRYSVDHHACSIVNAKSKMCGENCRFCAQSVHYEANVDVYGLMEPEQIVDAAATTHASDVTHFGIVTSGYGYKVINREFEHILEAIDLINKRFPDMNVCLSLGILGEEAVKELSVRPIGHYNINLQVNPARFSELIADSHDIQEKITTIRLLQRYDITVCCGGILGVGETMQDRVDLAFTLQDLGVSVIPLNVLVPIPGTPLEHQPPMSVVDIAKTFAIFRLVNPTKIIKFAAGRETIMKDFQGLLMLAGANGFITGGYLTTRGREVSDDNLFVECLAAFGAPKLKIPRHDSMPQHHLPT